MTTADAFGSAEQVRKLLAQWMQADDAGRDDEWLEEYLDQNFVFSVRGQVFEGLAAVRDLNATRPAARGVHILSEPVIDIDGDRARCVTAFSYLMAKPGGEYAVSLVGTYDDTFQRDASGRWRCTARSSTHLTWHDPVQSND